MIKTRKGSTEQVYGIGPNKLALTNEQMELIGALMGTIKLGYSKYQEAAMGIIDMLEEITGDDDYTSYCLDAVGPILEVYDDEYNVIATYDDDHIFEFIV